MPSLPIRRRSSLPVAAPDPEETDSSPGSGSWTADMSRRRFLRTGSLTMAAAAAVSAIPGVPALLGDAEADSPAAGSVGSAAASSAGPALNDAAGLDSPVTAHVSDLSGEVSVFVGDRTVTVRDPALVARILSAAK
jgi:hypothetical protein